MTNSIKITNSNIIIITIIITKRNQSFLQKNFFLKLVYHFLETHLGSNKP